MKLLLTFLLSAIAVFAQINVREGPFSTRPAASLNLNYFWIVNDCPSWSVASPCTAGGSLGAAAHNATFMSNGTNWLPMFINYAEIANTPTLGTAAAKNTTDFDASGAASSTVGAIPVSGVGQTNPALLSVTDRAAFAAKQPAGSYEVTTNRGAASGYAPLDSGSKVPLANMPFKAPYSTTAFTATGGLVTVDVTGGGFSAKPTSCIFTPTIGTAIPANAYNGVAYSYSSWTATQVQGYITFPLTVPALGGLGVQSAASGVQVLITCFP